MKKRYQIGKYSTPLEEFSLLAEMGFDFAEYSVPDVLIPAQDDDAWAIQKAKILEAQKIMRYGSLNGFLPGSFRLTGPEDGLTTEAALKFAETACRRADEVGIPYLVLGSSGARKAPEGFDVPTAKRQFVDFCKELVKRIADCKAVVLLENLQPKEDNILNYITESAAVVEEIASPRLQILADLFHMTAAGESPDAIRKVGKYIRHVHVADPVTRNWPGYSQRDLVDYIQALNDVDYQGGLSAECNYEEEGLHDQYRVTLKTIQNWMEKTK